ncbi:hypothetical protein Ddc_00189 [Ditylenchus destructor]|nr:hypothetical protein Ddc_00189 [Ditylenchus destructor]
MVIITDVTSEYMELNSEPCDNIKNQASKDNSGKKGFLKSGALGASLRTLMFWKHSKTQKENNSEPEKHATENEEPNPENENEPNSCKSRLYIKKERAPRNPISPVPKECRCFSRVHKGRTTSKRAPKQEIGTEADNALNSQRSIRKPFPAGPVCNLLLKLDVLDSQCEIVTRSDTFSFDVSYNKKGEVPTLDHFYSIALKLLNKKDFSCDELRVVESSYICPVSEESIEASLVAPVRVPEQKQQKPSHSEKKKRTCKSVAAIETVKYAIKAKIDVPNPGFQLTFPNPPKRKIIGEISVFLTVDFRNNPGKERVMANKNLFERNAIFKWDKRILYITEKICCINSTVSCQSRSNAKTFEDSPPNLKLLIEQLLLTLPDTKQVGSLELNRLQKWHDKRKKFLPGPMLHKNWQSNYLKTPLNQGDKFAILYTKYQL